MKRCFKLQFQLLCELVIVPFLREGRGGDMQKWQEDNLQALWRILNDAHCVRRVLLTGQPLVPTAWGHILVSSRFPRLSAQAVGWSLISSDSSLLRCCGSKHPLCILKANWAPLDYTLEEICVYLYHRLHAGAGNFVRENFVLFSFLRTKISGNSSNGELHYNTVSRLGLLVNPSRLDRVIPGD